MINGHYSRLIKEEARKLGFTYCGIAKAEALTEDARRLEQWLKKGYQGTMHYLERNFEKRIDPRLLVEGTKSIITLLVNYYPEEKQVEGIPKISRYAYGKDYHEVIRDKLNLLLAVMQEQIGDIHGRGFVDSAPVLERTWATKSGMGWVGKNGNLITKQQGSYFFIATLMVDIELEYDDPFTNDYCGTCTRCIDACPTDAIRPGKEIEGSRCISYYTIELKDALINSDTRWNDWIFGCDICQEVCPWNRFSIANTEKAFEPLAAIMQYNQQDWENLSEETFREVFRESPLKRSGYNGLMRNLRFTHSST